MEVGGNKVLTGMVKRIDKELADRHARHARRHRSLCEGALMFDLTGKTALVTGASGGIGGAIAKALHAQGATVVLSGTRAEALEAVKAELGARAFIATCNLSDIASVEALAQGGGSRGRRAASISWSTMPASPATISSCA